MDWSKVIDDADMKRRVREAEQQQELEERQQKQDAVRKITSACLRDVVYPVFIEAKDKVIEKNHRAEVKTREDREKIGQPIENLSFVDVVEITVWVGGSSDRHRVGSSTLKFSSVYGKPDLELEAVHHGLGTQNPKKATCNCNSLTREFVESEVAELLKTALS